VAKSVDTAYLAPLASLIHITSRADKIAGAKSSRQRIYQVDSFDFDGEQHEGLILTFDDVSIGLSRTVAPRRVDLSLESPALALTFLCLRDDLENLAAASMTGASVLELDRDEFYTVFKAAYDMTEQYLVGQIARGAGRSVAEPGVVESVSLFAGDIPPASTQGVLPFGETVVLRETQSGKRHRARAGHLVSTTAIALLAGQCHSLASSILESTDWPIYGVFPDIPEAELESRPLSERLPYHVMNRRPEDGMFVDSVGLWTEDQLRERFAGVGPTVVRRVTEEEMSLMMAGHSSRSGYQQPRPALTRTYVPEVLNFVGSITEAETAMEQLAAREVIPTELPIASISFADLD
jgi:hypothetical protein